MAKGTQNFQNTIDESFIRRAYKLSLLGLLDKDLADAFDVDYVTLYTWRNKSKALDRAIIEGRMMASARVAEAVYTRAVGYEKTVQEIKNSGGEAVVMEYTKYFPPNITAAMYWLNNRDKQRWGAVKKHEIGGTIKHEGLIASAIDVSSFSDAELALAEKMGVALEAKNDKVSKTLEQERIDVETEFKEIDPEEVFETEFEDDDVDIDD